MPIVAAIFALFRGLAAISSLVGYCEELAAMITAWYISKQKKDTLALIIDAASFAAHAETDEQRFQASEKWQEVFKRKRVTK